MFGVWRREYSLNAEILKVPQQKQRYILGIDLGGTNTKLGLFDENWNLVKNASLPTNAPDGPLAAAERWLKEVTPWNQSFKIAAVGIGSPGPLDCEKGEILETPNLKNWENFSFTKFFTKHLGVPCHIENDANCAALGEWHHHKVDDIVMITLGTGVGTGVISSGKLVRGVRGFGVEAGHMVIDMNGPRCECGRHGCFEAFVGAKLLVDHYNEKAKDKIPPLDAHAVFQKAKGGDAHAQELIKLWTKALAVGVGNLVNTFNPTIVTLSGGVSRAFHDVEPAFQKILLTEAFEPSLKCVKVVVSKLQEKAGVYGAAIWAQQQL